MKVYVAYLKDRHADAEVRVFADVNDAIRETRGWMGAHMAHPEAVEEEEDENYELWLSYTLEDDHAFVVEAEVEAPSKNTSQTK